MGFLDAVTEQAKKIVCASLRLNEALVGAAARTLFGEDSITAREIIRYYNLSKLCDPPPPPERDPDDDTPLCPCKLYTFTVTCYYINSSDVLTPLSFTRNNVAAPITFEWFRVLNDGGATDPWRFRYRSANPATCPNYEEFLTDLTQVAIKNGTTPYWTVNNLAEMPGQPPGCGDVPPPPPPITPYDPNDFTFDIDIFYEDDDSGNTFKIPVTFLIGEFNFNANLDLTIPVTVNLKPSFRWDVNIPISFNLEFNFNTGDVKTYPPTPPGTPPPRLPPPPKYDPDFDPGDDPDPPPAPPDVPDPDPEPDTPQFKRVITGAIVTVGNPEDASKVGQLGQNENPDVFFPDLGLVSFQIRHAKGVGWTEDIRVKNVRQFIPCPWGGGAISVKGTARGNATMTVTPVYGYPEERLVTT